MLIRLCVQASKPVTRPRASSDGAAVRRHRDSTAWETAPARRAGIGLTSESVLLTAMPSGLHALRRHPLCISPLREADACLGHDSQDHQQLQCSLCKPFHKTHRQDTAACGGVRQARAGPPRHLRHKEHHVRPDGHAMTSLPRSADARPQDVSRPVGAACHRCRKKRLVASMAATVVVAQALLSAACAVSLTLSAGPDDNASVAIVTRPT
jgi:hypothetical protein